MFSPALITITGRTQPIQTHNDVSGSHHAYWRSFSVPPRNTNYRWKLLQMARMFDDPPQLDAFKTNIQKHNEHLLLLLSPVPKHYFWLNQGLIRNEEYKITSFLNKQTETQGPPFQKNAPAFSGHAVGNILARYKHHLLTQE